MLTEDVLVTVMVVVLLLVLADALPVALVVDFVPGLLELVVEATTAGSRGMSAMLLRAKRHEILPGLTRCSRKYPSRWRSDSNLRRHDLWHIHNAKHALRELSFRQSSRRIEE